MLVGKSVDNNLNISLLRGFSLYNQDSSIEIKSQKAKAILAYLLLNGTGHETRERICGLFWSEAGSSKARDSLRQAVSALNRVLNSSSSVILKANRNELQLNIHCFDVDLLTILDSLKKREINELLLSSPRIIENLLSDFDDVDPEFQDWLRSIRQSFQNQIIRELEELLEISEGSLHKRICQALLNINSVHEPACRGLMLDYAQNGDVAGAIKIYGELCQVLEEEFGEEPSEVTQSLVAEIRLGLHTAIPEDVSEVVTRKPVDSNETLNKRLVIGVDAFVTDGVSEDKAYLVQGFRHELIACLTRFREFAVIDLKNAIESSTLSAATLAQYTINTTVYQSNDILILILTLQKNDTWAYVWSDRFELKLDSWFDVQHMIVRQLAIALNKNLSEERLEQIADKPDVSLDLYDRWLRAEHLTLSFKPETHERAKDIFRSIIKVDPNFSFAYIGLAEVENTKHLVTPGLLRAPAALEEGLELAQKAQLLAPLNSRSHLCLAWSFAMTGHYEQAVHSYLEACHLNENDPWTMISCAQGLAFCGEKEHALRLAKQASLLKIIPSPAHWGYQAVIQFLCEDYQTSVTAAEFASNIIYDLPAWKTAALYHLSRHYEATVEAEFLLNFIRKHWAVSSEATPLEITRWLLQCFPIKHDKDWYRLQAGLKEAGLSVPESPEY